MNEDKKALETKSNIVIIGKFFEDTGLLKFVKRWKECKTLGWVRAASRRTDF